MRLFCFLPNPMRKEGQDIFLFYSVSSETDFSLCSCQYPGRFDIAALIETLVHWDSVSL